MNKNQIQIFANEQFGKLEVLLIGGKPHFPASDCAKILGYKKPNSAIHQHCRAAVKHSTPISGKMQDINFISEGDLYRLIVRSKLPVAVEFEAWVFDIESPATIRLLGKGRKARIVPIMSQTAQVIHS